MKLWDKYSERGVILGAIVAIIFFVFIHPDPDVDLAVNFPGNPPYSPLWFFLNPFYWTKQLYPIIVFAEWSCVTLLQWWLVRKGILNRNLLLLQIMSTTFLFMIHADQDVTVIMFAPFAAIVPFIIGLEFLQKIPMPGTDQWTCAFNGGGLATNAYQNPCLSTGTKFFIFSTHIYSLTYILLVFWALYPLLFWAKGRASASTNQVLRPVAGVESQQSEWKGEGVEKTEYSLTPAIRTQLSTPLPTESCGCCHAYSENQYGSQWFEGPDNWEKFRIVETKNNKGHEFRFMVVSQRHASHVGYESYAISKLWQFMNSLNKDFAILQPDFASIKDHWHVVATTLDHGTDDEQVAKTRRLECRFK